MPASGAALGGFELTMVRSADDKDTATRQVFRKKLREGELDDKEIDVEIDTTPIGVEIMAPPGMEEMTSQLQSMFSNMGQGKKKSARLKVKDALKKIREEEAAPAGQRRRDQKPAPSKPSSRPASSSSTSWTRSPSAAKAWVRTCPAKACSATCCR